MYIKGDKNSFLFSFTKNTKHICINSEKEIWFNEDCYFKFGGFDLFISDNCNLNKNSFSILADSY